MYFEHILTLPVCFNFQYECSKNYMKIQVFIVILKV